MTNPTAWSSLKTAIVVCGHAVYHGGTGKDPEHAARDENWLLQPFQKGEGKYYISHIETGVRLAAEDSESLLIFSGGQTRAPSILSEAQGYHDIASVFNFWDLHDVRTRVTTEEFSRDSFDNVLFGIARFTECVGSLPHHVVIVTWAFKEARFNHHVWSIHWPITKFQFVGVGVPDDLQKAEAAEARTLAHFKKDASGYSKTSDGKLGLKKASRNPYCRQHGYSMSCPGMSRVLAWRGTIRIAACDVPWV